jgi:hypothetical protein
LLLGDLHKRQKGCHFTIVWLENSAIFQTDLDGCKPVRLRLPESLGTAGGHVPGATKRGVGGRGAGAVRRVGQAFANGGVCGKSL